MRARVGLCLFVCTVFLRCGSFAVHTEDASMIQYYPSSHSALPLRTRPHFRQHATHQHRFRTLDDIQKEIGLRKKKAQTHTSSYTSDQTSTVDAQSTIAPSNLETKERGQNDVNDVYEDNEAMPQLAAEPDADEVIDYFFAQHRICEEDLPTICNNPHLVEAALRELRGLAADANAKHSESEVLQCCNDDNPAQCIESLLPSSTSSVSTAILEVSAIAGPHNEATLQSWPSEDAKTCEAAAGYASASEAYMVVTFDSSFRPHTAWAQVADRYPRSFKRVGYLQGMREFTQTWATTLPRTSTTSKQNKFAFDCGHIIADSLGGFPCDIRNFFPQTPSCNRGGNWRQQERLAKRLVKVCPGRVEVKIEFAYDKRFDNTPPQAGSYAVRVVSSTSDTYAQALTKLFYKQQSDLLRTFVPFETGRYKSASTNNDNCQKQLTQERMPLDTWRYMYWESYPLKP